MPAVTESHNEGSPMEPALEHTPAGRRAVTAVAWLSVLFAAVSTGYALANPNPDAFGRTISPITPRS